MGKGREFHEIGIPGGQIVRTYKYRVSFNDGKSWEEMFLTEDETKELTTEFGVIIK